MVSFILVFVTKRWEGANELACNNTLLHGPVVQLFYKPKVNTVPARCSDVELVAEYC